MIKTPLQIAVVALSFVLFSAPSFAAEPALDATRIERMSKEASTPEQHAAVAKQYRLRAEMFEAKAQQHEAESKKLQRNPSPMAAKWPAMSRNSAERENRLAMEARRAAQECYGRADHHIRLAVEKQHESE
jgi:hypothetical protein